MSLASVEIARRVSDDEVAFYLENGWVKLERLVSPEVAGEMLAAARRVMGESPEGSTDVIDSLKRGDVQAASAALHRKGANAAQGSVVDTAWWQDYHHIARDDKVEPFYSFSFSKEMGENAQRFMDRDVPVRYYDDFVACKMPAGQPGGSATGWHQDMCANPLDRVGGMSVWLALDDLPPEKGTMRFLTGAFREGPLGRGTGRYTDKQLFDVYPKVWERYELSPPMHLRPGDATVHGMLTPHYAPENTTDTPRWGYATFYTPGDTLFTGSPRANFDGTGIEPFALLDHPNFPIIYP